MKPTPAFLSLLFLFLFATTSESRKEPGEYGKMVMKDNEISEGIEGLVVDGLKHKCEEDKNTTIVRNFEAIPNLSVYKEDIISAEEKKQNIVKNFEPIPNITVYKEDIISAEDKEQNIVKNL
nr:organ-specific protein P4 [Arachis hypogaea]